jgi:hypothetical protein
MRRNAVPPRGRGVAVVVVLLLAVAQCSLASETTPPAPSPIPKDMDQRTEAVRRALSRLPEIEHRVIAFHKVDAPTLKPPRDPPSSPPDEQIVEAEHRTSLDALERVSLASIAAQPMDAGFDKQNLEMNRKEDEAIADTIVNLPGCPAPEGRWLHSMAFLAGKLYVFGGVTASMLPDEQQTSLSNRMWTRETSVGYWSLFDAPRKACLRRLPKHFVQRRPGIFPTPPPPPPSLSIDPIEALEQYLQGETSDTDAEQAKIRARVAVELTSAVQPDAPGAPVPPVVMPVLRSGYSMASPSPSAPPKTQPKPKESEYVDRTAPTSLLQRRSKTLRSHVVSLAAAVASLTAGSDAAQHSARAADAFHAGNVAAARHHHSKAVAARGWWGGPSFLQAGSLPGGYPGAGIADTPKDMESLNGEFPLPPSQVELLPHASDALWSFDFASGRWGRPVTEREMLARVRDAVRITRGEAALSGEVSGKSPATALLQAGATPKASPIPEPPLWAELSDTLESTSIGSQGTSGEVDESGRDSIGVTAVTAGLRATGHGLARPQPRMMGSMVSLQGGLVLFGGVSHSWQLLGDVWFFDPGASNFEGQWLCLWGCPKTQAYAYKSAWTGSTIISVPSPTAVPATAPSPKTKPASLMQEQGESLSVHTWTDGERRVLLQRAAAFHRRSTREQDEQEDQQSVFGQDPMEGVQSPDGGMSVPPHVVLPPEARGVAVPDMPFDQALASLTSTSMMSTLNDMVGGSLFPPRQGHSAVVMAAAVPKDSICADPTGMFGGLPTDDKGGVATSIKLDKLGLEGAVPSKSDCGKPSGTKSDVHKCTAEPKDSYRFKAYAGTDQRLKNDGAADRASSATWRSEMMVVYGGMSAHNGAGMEDAWAFFVQPEPTFVMIKIKDGFAKPPRRWLHSASTVSLRDRDALSGAVASASKTVELMVVFGGCSLQGQALDDAWALNPFHGSWHPLKARGEAPMPRWLHASAAFRFPDFPRVAGVEEGLGDGEGGDVFSAMRDATHATLYGTRQEQVVAPEILEEHSGTLVAKKILTKPLSDQSVKPTTNDQLNDGKLQMLKKRRDSLKKGASLLQVAAATPSPVPGPLYGQPDTGMRDAVAIFGGATHGTVKDGAFLLRIRATASDVDAAGKTLATPIPGRSYVWDNALDAQWEVMAGVNDGPTGTEGLGAVTVSNTGSKAWDGVLGSEGQWVVLWGGARDGVSDEGRLGDGEGLSTDLYLDVMGRPMLPSGWRETARRSPSYTEWRTDRTKNAPQRSTNIPKESEETDPLTVDDDKKSLLETEARPARRRLRLRSRSAPASLGPAGAEFRQVGWSHGARDRTLLERPPLVDEGAVARSRMGVETSRSPLGPSKGDTLGDASTLTDRMAVGPRNPTHDGGVSDLPKLLNQLVEIPTLFSGDLQPDDAKRIRNGPPRPSRQLPVAMQVELYMQQLEANDLLSPLDERWKRLHEVLPKNDGASMAVAEYEATVRRPLARARRIVTEEAEEFAVKQEKGGEIATVNKLRKEK